MALEQGALHGTGAGGTPQPWWDWGPALPPPGMAGQGLEPRAPGEGAGGPCPSTDPAVPLLCGVPQDTCPSRGGGHPREGDVARALTKLG